MGLRAPEGRLAGGFASFARSPSSVLAADRLSAILDRQSGAAQAQFARDSSDAGSSLSGLAVAIPVLAAVALALALLGVRQRLQEYR
jgi:hypothetical protein